nr:hypothetical protein [Klebsiella pneumoniae subsp. pneumoniae]
MLGVGKATGIYFALPTQLTSNKIYDRFNAFCIRLSVLKPRNMPYFCIPALVDGYRDGGGRSPGGAWFNHRKRGLLAPFAVGTIDQALMAVMNVKHGLSRAYGLAGKVVILDEVHTTIYTLARFLMRWSNSSVKSTVPVIILSATLSQTRRDALLQQSTTSEAYPLITAAPSAEQDTVWSEIGVPVTENTTVILHSCRR